MSIERFVGRHEEREAIHRFVAEKPKGIIILNGHTDTGKSALIEMLTEDFKGQGHAAGLYRVEALDDTTRPLLDALAQVVGQLSIDESDGGKKQVIKNILNKEVSGSKFAKALVKDIVDTLKLKNTYENLADEFSEAFDTSTVETTIDSLLAENKASVHSTFIKLLRSLSGNLDGKKCVLCIDQAEDAGEPFWDFLVDVCKSLPGGFFVQFSVNPEKGASYDRLNKKYIGDLQNQLPKVAPVEGLSVADIELLIKEKTGKTFNKADLEHIRMQSGGRPLLILSWLKSEEFKNGKIDFPPKYKYDGFFKQIIGGLSSESRKLVKFLSLLPRHMDAGLEAYCDILGAQDIHVCADSMGELTDKEVFKNYEAYKWFTHDLIKDYVYRQLDDAERKDYANRTVAYIEANGQPEMESDSASLIYAEILTYTDDHEKAYIANSLLAHEAYTKSDFTLYHEAATRCKELSEKKGNKSWRAFALNELGLAHKAWGEYAKALELYEEALPIFKDVGDRSGEGATLNNMGSIAHAKGDYVKALECLEQSFIISREVGERSGEGATLNNISQIYKVRGDYVKALEYLEQSLVISRDIGDRYGEGVTLNNMGSIAHAKGDYGKALEYLEQSLAISREIGDRSGERATLNNIAHIYYQQGKFAEAIGLKEKVVKIDEDLGLSELEKHRQDLAMLKSKLKGE